MHPSLSQCERTPGLQAVVMKEQGQREAAKAISLNPHAVQGEKLGDNREEPQIPVEVRRRLSPRFKKGKREKGFPNRVHWPGDEILREGHRGAQRGIITGWGLEKRERRKNRRSRSKKDTSSANSHSARK